MALSNVAVRTDVSRKAVNSSVKFRAFAFRRVLYSESVMSMSYRVKLARLHSGDLLKVRLVSHDNGEWCKADHKVKSVDNGPSKGGIPFSFIAEIASEQPT